MKRIFSIALCFVMMASALSLTAFADDDMYTYYSIIDGDNVSGSLSAECFDYKRNTYSGSGTSAPVADIAQDTENGCITVTPDADLAAVDGRRFGEFRITLDSPVDASGLYNIGYIRLRFKSQMLPKEVWCCPVGVNAKNGRGCNGGQRNYLNASYNPIVTQQGEWLETKMPLNQAIGPKSELHDSTKGADVITEFYVMFIFRDTPATPVDIAEISVCGPDDRPFAQLEFSGMNNDGKYEVRFGFNRSIDATTADSAAFDIDGTYTESCDYDSVTGVYTLLFDMVPEFPSEYTLNIGGDIRGTNGLPAKPELLISNPSATPTAAIDKNATTCVYTENGVALNAKVNCIYDKTSSGQSITVVAAVFKGDDLIAIKASDTKSLAFRASDIFTVEITDLADTDGIRTEVYLTDTAENGRPLAEMTSFAKK